MLPQVKGIFNNEIHLKMLAFVKFGSFKGLPVAKKCQDFCKNMSYYFCKNATKTAKICSKIGKFYAKNCTQIGANFTPQGG